MGALKSFCKALDHIRMLFWSLCRWNARFCHTILSEARAHRVDFGPHKAADPQSNLDRTSVLLGGNECFVCVLGAH